MQGEKNNVNALIFFRGVVVKLVSPVDECRRVINEKSGARFDSEYEM